MAEQGSVQMVKPPYQTIWKELKAGRVIPFLGAGASISNLSKTKWNPDNPNGLPSGKELSEWLATGAEFPSKESFDREDLAKVASYFMTVNGRPTLRIQLREILNHNFAYGSLHRFSRSISNLFG